MWRSWSSPCCCRAAGGKRWSEMLRVSGDSLGRVLLRGPRFLDRKPGEKGLSVPVHHPKCFLCLKSFRSPKPSGPQPGGHCPGSGCGLSERQCSLCCGATSKFPLVPWPGLQSACWEGGDAGGSPPLPLPVPPPALPMTT